MLNVYQKNVVHIYKKCRTKIKRNKENQKRNKINQKMKKKTEETNATGMKIKNREEIRKEIE